MLHRIRILIIRVGGAFWLIPALMVLAGIFGAVGAVGLVSLDRSGLVPDALISSA